MVWFGGDLTSSNPPAIGTYYTVFFFYTIFNICSQKVIVLDFPFIVLFTKERKLHESDKEKCETEAREL